MKSLVSVIIPIYNAEIYLEETILSVLNQTYENFELILVNHNSNDNSKTIIEKYQQQDKRIKVITLDVNKGGPGYPRNEGIKVATGEYIAFIDSDDVWLSEKLERQVQFLQEREADVVHTLAYSIDEKSNITGTFMNQRVYNKFKYFFSIQSIIYYTNFININSVLMKKDSNICFSEDVNLVAMEDWKLWMESILNGKKVILLEEKLLNYRIHNLSASKRESDIGYRKSLHLLSLMLLEKKIPLRHFIFSSILNLFKIALKNLRS